MAFFEEEASDYILAGDFDPSSTSPGSFPAGTLFIYTSGGSLWQKQDDGNTTNYLQVGGGGGGNELAADMSASDTYTLNDFALQVSAIVKDSLANNQPFAVVSSDITSNVASSSSVYIGSGRNDGSGGSGGVLVFVGAAAGGGSPGALELVNFSGSSISLDANGRIDGSSSHNDVGAPAIRFYASNGSITLAHGTGKRIQFSQNLPISSTPATLSGAGLFEFISINGPSTYVLGVQPPLLSGNWTFTFPVDGGTLGYILSTDGSGATSWIAPAAPVGGDGAIQFSTAGAFDGNAGLLFFNSGGWLNIDPNGTANTDTDANAVGYLNLANVGGSGLAISFGSMDGSTPILDFYMEAAAALIGTDTNHPLTFYTNSLNAMTIKETGVIQLNPGTATTEGNVWTASNADASGTFNHTFINAPQGAVDPVGVVAGSIYFDTVAGKLKVFNGVTWETITSA